jgi:hypothetical protein
LERVLQRQPSYGSEPRVVGQLAELALVEATNAADSTTTTLS